MRESILTIPINEVFEPKCGCPICRMRDDVERHISEYIMGAAMMEPDVREETNAMGFCRTHYDMLLQQNNRLSLGLMLNSHLMQLTEEYFGRKSSHNFKKAEKKSQSEIRNSCFVCSKVDWGTDHMLKTVFVMFAKDEAFKKLYSEQEYICFPHYLLLMSQASSQIHKSVFPEFKEKTDALVKNYLISLNKDVGDFCNSFDYRNAGKLHSEDGEKAKTSVSRSIKFLTSRGQED